jgi:WD40 repeat protein
LRYCLDGKSDNIIVVETPTGTPGKTTSQLIGIDNDHAFVPPVAKKALLFTQLLVKNILYCFDEMKKPIHEEVREEILELSADEVLTRWLMGVQQRDRLYCSLFTEDEMVTLFTNKDESKRSVVRMLVPPDLAVNLYAKFRKLQEILSSGKRVTHIDLLSDLEPLLDKYYVESLKRPGPPAERFRKLVESEYEGKMQAGAGVTKTDASRSIKSVLQALPTIEQIRNQTKFSVTDAIEKLTEIKKLVQNIESVRDAIMEGNLAPMKALTMPDMRQRVLARLLWDTLPTNTTVSLIRLLAGMDYISLRFSKCASLNSALLNPLMRPKLTSLDLSDCPNILADSITTIASTCQRLQRLNIRNCTGITRIGHDESNINALRPVSFPALQRIFMRGCTKMSEFIVRAPCLVELETAENVSPKNYVKSIYDLSHASSLEKVTLIDGTIARITRLRPPQPVPAGVSSSQSKQSFYPMMDLAFDGDKLVTAGHDGVLEWWDIQTTQMHHGIDVTEASPGTTVVHRAIPNVILLPPDRIVYALRKDGVYVRDLTTHNILQRYPSSKVDCCGIADGSILLIGSQGSGVPAAAQGATSPGSRQWADGTVEAWDIAEQKLIATLSEPESDTPYPYDITCVVGSGPLVAASHFARATSETTASVKEKKADQQKRVRIKVWDMKTPNKPITTLVGHERRVMDLKLVGSSLFSCSADNTIRKWDCYTGACTMQLSTLESPLRHFNPVSSVQVVDNGKLLMSASTDRTIRFWDLKTGHCVRTVMGGLGMITTARMDGNMIFAGCSDGSVTVFTLFFPTAPKRRPVPQQPQ